MNESIDHHHPYKFCIWPIAIQEPFRSHGNPPHDHQHPSASSLPASAADLPCSQSPFQGEFMKLGADGMKIASDQNFLQDDPTHSRLSVLFAIIDTLVFLINAAETEDWDRRECARDDTYHWTRIKKRSRAQDAQCYPI
ncbi:hypothetical protein PGTUg99_017616 [Puccinia graminis f. sp. tritici]|uniref:Uncharacterized protein n=1 Tax=Puccinia graminis f. sp. tritici TaxID=56615 RepID=A0A5B0Q1P0_PUCGR|nr:hypothetical protein PGTUg99_017616 [Puccinia graminis f. sp. tritici]